MRLAFLIFTFATAASVPFMAIAETTSDAYWRGVQDGMRFCSIGPGGGGQQLRPFLSANPDVDFYALQVMRSKVMVPFAGEFDIESVTGDDIFRSLQYDPELMRSNGIEIILFGADQLGAGAGESILGWSTTSPDMSELAEIAIDPGIFEQFMEGMQVDAGARVKLYNPHTNTFQD